MDYQMSDKEQSGQKTCSGCSFSVNNYISISLSHFRSFTLYEPLYTEYPSIKVKGGKVA